MWNRRGALALAAAVVVCSTGLGAQKTEGKHEVEQQNREIQSARKLVDEVMTGEPAPNDLALAWVRSDLLKAQGNKQYVPFTVSLDQSKTSAAAFLVYWRVVAPGAASDAAVPMRRGDAKDPTRRRIDYP
jgi:hypothetical protein